MSRGLLNEVLGRTDPTLDSVAAAVASLDPSFPGEEAIVAQFDTLAEGAPNSTPGLFAHVFGVVGFRPDRDSYYSPENSLIHHVLERRQANPLGLALVTSEIGRRVGLDLAPVGMPGHALIGSKSEPKWYDPFAAGRQLDLNECRALFHRVFPHETFQPTALGPMSPMEVADRLLQNMRVAALRGGDIDLLARVLAHRLQLPGSPVEDRVELASVLGVLGRFELAAAQHDRLVELRPDHAAFHKAAAAAQRARNN